MHRSQPHAMADRQILSLPSFAANVNSKVAMWEKKDEPAKASSSGKPLSFADHHYQKLGVHQNDPNYGRPEAGSRTELRGKQAGVHISSEIVELCGVIYGMGVPLRDGTVGVRFGALFEAYTKISNKMVGMLMRARKQKLVDFEGEMLYQRRDDDKIIRLLKSPEELEAEIERQRDEIASHPSARK